MKRVRYTLNCVSSSFSISLLSGKSFYHGFGNKTVEKMTVRGACYVDCNNDFGLDRDHSILVVIAYVPEVGEKE